jgi:hypothetical protein
MIEYVLDELQDYVKLVDEATGIEVSCFCRKKNRTHLSPGLLRRWDLAV